MVIKRNLPLKDIFYELDFTEPHLRTMGKGCSLANVASLTLLEVNFNWMESRTSQIGHCSELRGGHSHRRVSNSKYKAIIWWHLLSEVGHFLEGLLSEFQCFIFL